MSLPLSLSDRFFGAILGLQTAWCLETQTSCDTLGQEDSSAAMLQEQAAAMLLQYNPLASQQRMLSSLDSAPASSTNPNPSDPISPSTWVEQILHQLLRNELDAIPAHSPELPASVAIPWASFIQGGQAWSISLPLLLMQLVPASQRSHKSHQPESSAQPQTIQRSSAHAPSTHPLQEPTHLEAHTLSLLGFWIGAYRGPQGIPLHTLSLRTITLAKTQANQLYWTWAGCHRVQKVEV